MNTNLDISQLDFSKTSGDLLTVVAQDISSGKVLMLAFANKEAVEKTVETGEAHFFSRSRNELWRKGETSGNVLKVKGIKSDCDGDALLYLVDPVGPACHTGKESCFFSGDDLKTDAEFLFDLQKLIQSRKKEMPEGSYLASLFSEGLDRVAQKVGEEGVEVVISAKNDDREEFLGESADLLFHLMVLLAEKGESLDGVLEVLKKRQK